MEETPFNRTLLENLNEMVRGRKKHEDHRRDGLSGRMQK